MTYQNTIDAFRAAMIDAGMPVKAPLITDGVLHRCHVEGDKTGTKNGAYILHLDGKPSGYFEHFKSGLKQTWSLSGNREPMIPAMRKQIEDDRRNREIEQAERQKEAADKARLIWRSAKPAGDTGQHPYLISKGIKPYLARLDGNALVVPIFDESRELVNLQFIKSNGDKRFLSGGRKKGCFSVIGDATKQPRLLICEGYATGASLHQELGIFVMVAMDAGNLEPVALAARRLFPDYEITIMGDNDENGVGQQAARLAAVASGGKYLIPQTPGDDWNDALTKEAV